MVVVDVVVNVVVAVLLVAVVGVDVAAAPDVVVVGVVVLWRDTESD